MADRQQRLDRSVRSLLALEHAIGAAVESLEPRLMAVLPEDFGGTLASHRQALASYLVESGNDPGAATGSTPVVDIAALAAAVDVAGPVSATAAALYGLLSQAAIGYAALFEMALKLYDPKLRDVAPRHLNDHKAGAAALATELAPIVAGELAADDLECQCVCPMCSLGACGCVSFGRLVAASLVPSNGAQPEAGFWLETPRRGSQLAAAGVASGDRLLSVDDQPVATLFDIQAAIRKHSVGEGLRLLVARGDSTRTIDVTHAGDYS